LREQRLDFVAQGLIAVAGVFEKRSTPLLVELPRRVNKCARFFASAQSP
jgi:hypothetical protein